MQEVEAYRNLCSKLMVQKDKWRCGLVVTSKPSW